MLETFRHGEYAFVYPGNWQVVEQQFDDLPYTVTVQAPEGAFWSLTIYAFPRDPQEMLDETTAAMRGDYEDFETEDLAATSQAENDAVEREMTFIYLDFVVTSRATAFRHGRSTCLAQRQAESREFERLQPVFDAMLQSFLADGALPGVA